jgi:UDP-N-acetyl-D-glucosamine dehydrogenase
MKTELTRRIESKEAVIGIIGMGYVGLPLALRFSEAGFRVTGFDLDPAKAESIADRQSYFAHIADARISVAVDCGLAVTTNTARTAECDAIIICVPTPLGSHQEPDLSFITGTMESLINYLRPGQVVCLESTTYPGTTDEEIVPRAEQAGLNVGEDVFVVYSPEREDPGNQTFNTQTIPKVVGGVTSVCLEVGEVLYGQVIDEVVAVSSTRAAEMTKLLENIHRAVNIGLVNELKMVTDKMGIDIFEVINAAASKPFGFTPYYPGPGLGGHCIPIDPFYLTWKAKEYGVHTRFIE